MNAKGMLRGITRLAACSVLLCAACKQPKKPNTDSPEDKLLYEWGGALLAGDKTDALRMYDLELRQKLDLWDKTLKPVNKPDQQATLLAQAMPRLTDKAAMDTVGDEAWAEVKSEPWIQEVADGLCISGRPGKDDVGRGVIPHERKEMPQELGMWVFELRTAVTFAPAFRVSCPKSGSFWIQMAQRKKGASGEESPLKIVRVMK